MIKRTWAGTVRLFGAIIMAAMVFGSLATAQTVLQIQRGTGDLLQWTDHDSVEAAMPLTFRWSTTIPGAAGVRWQADRPGATTRTGVVSGGPPVGALIAFDLPTDAFLATPAPNPGVAFTVTATAVDGAGSALGAASAPVTVYEGPAGPPIPIACLDCKPPPFVEAGHPVAKFVAYKPLPFDGTQGDAEGLLVLEFSNPATVASNTVFVRVGDLHQVARQADPSAFVPPLAPGQTFRIALALWSQGALGDTDQSWLKRYKTGVVLLVGTQKPGSPFTQFQQPPVRIGPTDQCAGEGCGASSPPHVALMRSNVPQIDMNVAAGFDYLYAGDYNDFDVFTKRARARVDLIGTALSRTAPASALAWEKGAAANLFSDFWAPGGARDLNPGFMAIAPASPCDPAHPVVLNPDGKTLAYQPGFLKVVTGAKPSGALIFKIIGYPSGGCLNDFYDTRMTFDPARNRFWIVTHARNQMARDAICPDGPSPKCALAHLEATRLTFAAVSKTERPADGFFTFEVNEDYADWPVMAVHADYALFSHNNSGGTRLRIYDADKMAAGIAQELGQAYTTDDFPSPFFRVAKHHGGSSGMTYIAATKGADLWVYALHSPHPATGRPPLLTSNRYTDPAGDSVDIKELAYRDGALYIVGTGGKRVLVWKLPVAPSFDKTSIVIDTAGVRKWVIKDAGASPLTFDYPSLDVNKHDDIVVSFRASSKAAANQVRYAVFYHDESQFRKPKVLTVPIKTGKGGGRIDYVTSTIDPSDDETVWFIGRDQDGAVIGSVRP